MKAHRTDLVSLTFALIFLAAVGWWLIAQFVNLPAFQVGWLLAIALIMIGVLGLIGVLRGGRNNQSTPAASSTVPSLTTDDAADATAPGSTGHDPDGRATHRADA